MNYGRYRDDDRDRDDRSGYGGQGGYGNPHERDPKAVAEDVADGYVSAEAARRDYGWRG